MRNSLRLVATIGVLLLCLGVAPVFAATYTFSPTPSDLWDLDHYQYYTWGIQNDFPGQIVDSVSIGISNINNWNNEPNALYIHAMDLDYQGVLVGVDWEADPDQFDGQGILLGGSPFSFPFEPAVDFQYALTSDEVSVFRGFAADGLFGFGFDPDCHYFNDGITVTVNTSPVPEPSTLILLGTGLIGLSIVGRKRFHSPGSRSNS